MPYKSLAQQAYIHIHKPEIAKRWDKEYGSSPSLPKHVADTNMKPKKRKRKSK